MTEVELKAMQGRLALLQQHPDTGPVLAAIAQRDLMRNVAPDTETIEAFAAYYDKVWGGLITSLEAIKAKITA